MRKEHVVLRRRKFFQGRKIFGAFKDLMWLRPDGSEMNEETWNRAKIHVIGMMLVGYAMDEFNQHGERISDDKILVLLNADSNAVHFTLPRLGERWELLALSKRPNDDEKQVESGKNFRLEARSSGVLRRTP
jgi:glycogen operon protein